MIKTLEDWNQYNTAWTDMCPFPLCSAPTAISESIKLTPCGWELPDPPEVPAEDKCIHYRKATREETRDYNYTDTTGGSTYHETQTELYVNVYEKLEAGAGACYQREASSQQTISQSITVTPDGGGAATHSTDVLTTSSTLAGPCTGSQTHTEGDDSDTTTDVGGLCYHPGLETPDSDWAYTSPGVYTFTELDDSDGKTYDKRVYTITFSEPIDAAFVAELLTHKDFPADVNGTASIAETLPYTGCEDADSVASGSKSRTRFKIPFTHKGTAFKLDGDSLFSPVGWDAKIPDPGNPSGPEIPDPSAPARELTALASLVWAGPGNAADSDDDDWLTSWWPVLLVPSGKRGTVELANVRYTHLPSNPAGVKPQYISSFTQYTPP